jgi:hypothetical protein
VFSQNDNNNPNKRRRKKLDVNYSTTTSGFSSVSSTLENEENRPSSGRENIPANILPGFPSLSTFDQFSPVKDRQSIPFSAVVVTNSNPPSVVNPSTLFQSNSNVPSTFVTTESSLAVETSVSSQKAKRVSLNLSQNVISSSFSSSVSSSAGAFSSSSIAPTVTPFTKSLKTPGTSDFIPFQTLQQTAAKQGEQQPPLIVLPSLLPTSSLLLDMELPDSLWCSTFDSIDTGILSLQSVEDIDINMDPGVYCNSFYLEGIHANHKELEKTLSPFPYYLDYHKSIQKMHRANLIDVIVSDSSFFSLVFLPSHSHSLSSFCLPCFLSI